MLKRAIAAVLLVAMTAWTEMALAPMLAMRAGHMHPALEMAEIASHHTGMPSGHHCCPKIGDIRKANDQDLIYFTASSPPCQNEHRCCFRQGPQNVPAPVSLRASHGPSRELARAEVAALIQTSSSESKVFLPFTFALGSPPSVFGMSLRV